MNRLLVRGDPVGPFQHIYVFEGDKMTESIGIGIDDLEEVVFEIAKKYNITQIDLSGSRVYMQGIEAKLKEAGITLYDLNSIHFRYV